MPQFDIRKTTLIVEEIHHDGGPAPEQPRRRAAMLALVRNPFAGRHEPDLQPAMEDLKPLGLAMSRRLIAALDGPEGIDAYGKGALVGAGGEAEHGALWHVPGGYAMRELLGESRAIVPSAMKVGAMGATLDVPLGHINAAYVRSHFDAFTVSMPDGPRACRLRAKAAPQLRAFAMSSAERAPTPQVTSRVPRSLSWLIS